MIFTFYSYKGGVGRTHLLANLASYLCYYQKRKILIIDWDLEAPGVHYYFDKKDKDIQSKGLIDLCNDQIKMLRNAEINQVITEKDYISPFENYITNLKHTENGGKIDLMPATNYNEIGYHNTINDFDWIDFHDNLYGGSYLLWLKDQLKKKSHYDYVFIDSRTGQNDYSGICNVLMPDMNILVIAPNIQNFEGTRQMADRIINSNYVKEGKRQPFILPILSRIDESGLQEADKWKEKFVEEFNFCIPIFDKDLKSFSKEVFDIILTQTYQKYNASFSLGENIYFEETTPNLRESSFLKNMENIALNFLEEMNENEEIDLKKMIHSQTLPPHEFWHRLGTDYHAFEQFDKAIECYQKVIEIKPDNYSVWNKLGIAYNTLKQFDKAIETYQKAIEIKSDKHEAWYNLGNTYKILKQFDKAIESYQKAIEIKPDNYQARYNLGSIYEKLKQYQNAVELFKKVIDIKLDDYYAWNKLGIAYHALKQFDKAIKSYQKAIEIKSGFHEAWYNLGLTYQNLQQYDKAIESYQKAIEIKPDKDEAWYNLGIAYYNLQKYDKASEYFQKAVEIKPDKDEAWNNLGLTYQNLQQYDKAIESYQKAIDLKFYLNEAWYNLGNVYNDLQQYNNAIKAYQKATEIKPNYYKAWSNLGNVYLSQKEYKKAQESLEKALSIEPNDANAFYNLACLFSLQKDKNKALEYLQRAVEDEQYKKDAQTDTDFEWLWQDIDFQNIVKD